MAKARRFSVALPASPWPGGGQTTWLLLGLGLAALSAGCGQKGPLTLPAAPAAVPSAASASAR